MLRQLRWRRSTPWWLCGLLFVLGLTVACQSRPFSSVSAASIAFTPPENARIISVLEFGAMPDDEQDDTAAIQAAIASAIDPGSRYGTPKFVFLPRGTYLLSDTLESRVAVGGWADGWRAGMILMGESRQGTVLKLQDNLPAFANAENPKSMIRSGSESDGESNPDGGGNRAFRHSVFHLTLDTGRGNAGAVGIDYLANNRGAIEDVTIQSADGSGVAGIAMPRFGPGPALIKNVAIDGFDYGISIEHYEYHMTLENISLTGQRRAGIENAANTLSIRSLNSVNDVPALVVDDRSGFVVLVDSQLSGGPTMQQEGIAIESAGRLFLRNITVKDYAVAVRDTSRLESEPGEEIRETQIAEYTSFAPTSLFSGRTTSLNLEVQETPTYDSTDLSEWADAEAYGATADNPEDDDAPGIQAAIDAGKPVVYLPNGSYTVGSTLRLRGNLKKLIGMQSAIQRQEGFEGPILELEDGSNSFVVLEHLYLEGDISHAADRSLSVRHCDFQTYRNTDRGTGNLFVEDVIGRLSIQHPQQVWARQLNTEFVDPLLQNAGGTVWVLGFKTEGTHTALEATQGGQTEILGGAFRPNASAPDDTPVAIIQDSSVAMAYRITGSDGSQVYEYPLQIQETQGQTQRELAVSDLRSMGLEQTVPLYLSTP